MRLLKLIRDTFLYWQRNEGPRRSAALTYYAIGSLTSLIILMLAAAGLFFNPERVSLFLVSPVAEAIGEENSGFIRELVQSYYNPEASYALGVISLLLMLNTGSHLFMELGFSLNRFLNIDVSPPALPRARQILRFLLERLEAFGFVLGAELVILAGLFATAGLQFADERVGGLIDIPFDAYEWGSRLLRFTLAVVMLALLYRFVPEKRMPWRAVWSGAVVAGLLFTLLQGLMSLFLASAGIGSAFGAAGSLVVFLYWVYYSIQSLFFGAAWAHTINAGQALAAE